MNPAIQQLFNDYLAITDDKAAAASLALADVMLGRQPPTDRPLTVPEVARILRVSRAKVIGWIQRGDLKAANVTEKPGGRPRWRINPGDLEVFKTFKASLTSPPRPVRRRRLPPVPDYS